MCIISFIKLGERNMLYAALNQYLPIPKWQQKISEGNISIGIQIPLQKSLA